MKKHNCACGCKEKSKCQCGSTTKTSKTKTKTKVSKNGNVSRQPNASHHALGTDANPLKVEFAHKSNDYDVGLNTRFGQNPYRNVLGNFQNPNQPQLNPLAQEVNQYIPLQPDNVLNDYNNPFLLGYDPQYDNNNIVGNMFNPNNRNNRLQFDNRFNQHQYLDENERRYIQHDDLLQITEDGEPTDAEEYTVTEPYDIEDEDYIDNMIWEQRHFNRTRGVFNEFAQQVPRYDPNEKETQTSPHTPLDNFLQPTQENHLVTPVKLFDDEEAEPTVSEETEGTQKLVNKIAQQIHEEEENHMREERGNGRESHDEKFDRLKNRYIGQLQQHSEWEPGGMIPTVPEFDNIDKDSLTDNNEYHRFYRYSKGMKNDELRYLIRRDLEASHKGDVRGELQSIFDKRKQESLRDLYAKILLYRYFHL